MIWSVPNEQLLSKLRGEEFQDSYRDPMLLNFDKNLGVLHDQGIDLWQLKAPLIQSNLWDSAKYAKMHLLEDGEHMVIEFEKKRFVLVEVDTFRIIREYQIPENTVRHYQLNDGDLLLVIQNPEYDPTLGEFETRDPEKRNRESLRDLKKLDLEKEMGGNDPAENLESQLRSVIARNRMMKKSNKNVSSFRSNQRVPSMKELGTEEVDLEEEKKNPRDKRDQLGNIMETRDEDKDQLSMPDTVKLEMEDIDDDDEMISNYNINSLKPDTALSKYANSMLETPSTLQSTLRKTSKLPKKVETQHNINVRVNGELVSQEISHERFKYRVVRVLMERYLDKNSEDKAMYTLFQTNSEIVEMKSQLVNIEKNEDAKGATNYFKRLQSRVKANSPFAGNRTYLIVLGLMNKNIYRVDYTTNKYSVPIKDRIIAERIFRMSAIDAEIEANLNNPQNKKNNKMLMRRMNTLNFTQTEASTVYDTGADQTELKSPLGSIRNVYTTQKTRLLDSVFLVKAVEYIPDHEVTLAVMLNQNIRSKKFSLMVLGQEADQPYAEIRINFDQSIRTNLEQKFYIEIMRVPKKTHKEPVYEFCVYSSLFLATFKFHLRSNELEFHKFLKKETSSFLKVRYSVNRRLFYIPLNSQIHIYDETLSHFVFYVDTEKNIDECVLLDSHDIMIIYDKKNYYELDLDELKFRLVLPASSEALENFRYLLNFTVLVPGSRWSATFHTKNKHQIFSVPFQENLDLISFPFEDLLKCFLKKNYKRFLKTFARYYFGQLKESDRQDFNYGSLNPLLFAIYNNDSGLLEELLENYFYPRKIVNYVSPLEYSFAMNYPTTIKVLCDHLIRRDDFVHFSRADFKKLLKSNILTCHKLIASIPSEPAIKILPKLVYMTSNVNAYFQNYLTSLLIHIKMEDLKHFRNEPNQDQSTEPDTNEEGLQEMGSDAHLEVLTESKKELDLEIERTTKRYVQDNTSDHLFKSEVTIKSVPFKYNYNTGTEDSVTFVYNYSKSENQDFIMSDWKEIIQSKWRGVKFPYIFLTFCYFSYTIFFLLSSVFYNDLAGLRGMSILMNIILIIFEVIQMLTYFSYKPSM